MNQLRLRSLILLSLLGFQFILGMILNLFVQIPQSHPGTHGNYFDRSLHSFTWAITNGGGIVLLIHVLVAIGLLVNSLILLASAIAAKNKPWISASVIGALGVIAALTNGLAFLGYNHNLNSFIMALGFIVAATAYSTALTFESGSSLVTTNKTNESAHYKGKFRHSHS